MEKRSDDKALKLTEDDVAAFPDENRLNRALLIRSSKPEERLDWGSGNWTTLCADYLKIFPCFPLPKLILEICHFYDLALSQLMPAVWSVILSLEFITKDWDEKLSLTELLQCSSFKRKSSGLFTLLRGETKHLIVTLEDSVRRWKRRFIVVHKKCLIPNGNDIRTEWNNLFRIEDKKIAPRPNCSDLIAAIMALPEDRRTYTYIFGLEFGSKIAKNPVVPKLSLKDVVTGKKRSNSESSSSSEAELDSVATRFTKYYIYIWTSSCVLFLHLVKLRY